VGINSTRTRWQRERRLYLVEDVRGCVVHTCTARIKISMDVERKNNIHLKLLERKQLHVPIRGPNFESWWPIWECRGSSSCAWDTAKELPKRTPILEGNFKASNL
jgi:hypothetical protein